MTNLSEAPLHTCLPLNTRMCNTKKISFTLFELCLVMALISVMAGLSFRLFLPSSQSLMRNQLRVMQTLFVYLQQKAIASNQDIKLFLDQEKNSYYFSINTDPSVHHLDNHHRFGFIAGIHGPPAKPTHLIDSFTTFKKQDNLHVITFFANGTISVGALYIIDNKQTTMGALTCSVSQVSYVRKYLYTGNMWTLLTP